MLMPVDNGSPSSVRLNLLGQGLSQLLIFFLPAVLFVLLYKGNTATFLHLDFHGRKWILAGVAMVVFLLLVPVSDWITWWNDQWNLGPLQSAMRHMSDASKLAIAQMLSLTSVGDLLLQLFVVALIPAVCEEIFFRGALQQILRQWFGNIHVAILVTALLFTLAHGDVYGLVPRFLFGLLLGYMFHLSGSLLVNISAHFINNALIVVLYYLYHKGVLATSPEVPLQLPWLTTLLCTLAAVALFALYFLSKDRKNPSKKSI